MASKNIPLDNLKYTLESALQDLYRAEKGIKNKTDDWVSAQKQKIQTEEMLEKLGYKVNMSSMRRGSWTGSPICKVKLSRLYKDKTNNKEE